MYCTIQEKRSKKPSLPFPQIYHSSVYPEAFKFPTCEPRRQPAQACKWFIFKMYISGTFDKMRGNIYKLPQSPR